MKFFLTKKQVRNLSEVWMGRGKLRGSDQSYEKIFNEIDNDFSEGTILRKALKEYFKNVLGKELSKNKIEDLASRIHRYDELPELKNEDIRSNLAYFLAKKFLKIKKAGNLEYVKLSAGFSDYLLVFFDPELEISVGHITLSYGYPIFGETPRVIDFSSVDEPFIGKGFGKEMYFALLDMFKIVGSDKSLYGESLNIWVNVLPKVANVFAYLEGGGYIQIIPGKNPPKPDMVDRYYATKSKKIIRKINGKK